MHSDTQNQIPPGYPWASYLLVGGPAVASPVVAARTPSQYVGVANVVQWVGVQEWHAHDQPSRQPLAAVDGISMATVTAAWLAAQRLRGLF